MSISYNIKTIIIGLRYTVNLPIYLEDHHEVTDLWKYCSNVHLLLALALVGVVLIQRSKGGGLGMGSKAAIVS